MKYVNQWGCISIEEMSKGKVKTVVHLYRYHTIKPHDRGLFFFQQCLEGKNTNFNNEISQNFCSISKLFINYQCDPDSVYKINDNIQLSFSIY